MTDSDARPEGRERTPTAVRPPSPPGGPDPALPPEADAAAGDEDRVLRRYLHEIAERPLLTRSEEGDLGRAIRHHARAVREQLAAVPFTAALAVDHWHRLRGQGQSPGALCASPAERLDRSSNRRIEESLARLERRLRRQRSRAGGPPRTLAGLRRFEANQQRAVLEADLASWIFDDARSELRRRARALEAAARRGRRARAREIESEVGLPAQRLRERLTAAERSAAIRDEAKNSLASHNLRLVVSVAKNFRGLGLPFLDLIQEANLGLLRAIELFDPDRGYKFSTYAVWWIRQSLVRGVQNHSRTVRLPTHMNDRLLRFRRARADLTGRLGRAPTVDELAGALDLPRDVTERLDKLRRTPVELDRNVGTDRSQTFSDLLGDPRACDPHDRVDRTRAEMALDGLLAQLDSREQAVIRRRFGFDEDADRPTLQSLGRELGLSRERVRQVERQALRKLRDWAEERGLRSHLAPPEPGRSGALQTLLRE